MDQNLQNLQLPVRIIPTCYHRNKGEVEYILGINSLVPRPSHSFPSLAVRLSGRGPGTFSHVRDVTDRANYANVGVM